MAAAETPLPRHLELGRIAEELAAVHLSEAGAEILLRNFRRRCGELDIVARHGSTLLIVEVRLRSDSRLGDGAASVDRHKQRRITNAARQLLQQRRDLARYPVRFDVISLSPAASSASSEPRWRIEWLKHAFDAAH